MRKKNNIETQYYDKRSKIIVNGLRQWLYNRLGTGVAATVGREVGQELLEKRGRRRRICDALFELLDAIIGGRLAALALMHLEVQTRAVGDELRRSAGYRGLIVESDAFEQLEYFVQAFVFLTPVPPKLKTLIHGFPDDIRLYFIDMSRVDGLELLKENKPEAAVFAALSLVVPRNLLIAGIVEILNALATLEEWAYWTETVYAFALLRKDYLEFHMELTQEIERTAVHPDRQAELQFIYRPFYEKGLMDGRDEGLKQGRDEGLKQGRDEGLKQGRDEGLKQGRDEGLKQGRDEGLKQGRDEGLKQGLDEGLKQGRMEEKIQVAMKMLEKGATPDFIAEITGLDVKEILNL